MANGIRSYSDIFEVGHKALEGFFEGDVLVEEKIDGSQFSFGKMADGVLCARSKGKQLVLDAPEKMFELAVESLLSFQDRLPLGVTFRGEYLQKPKHNTMAYERVPLKNIIIFDVDNGYQDYMDPEQKKAAAEALGLETVPVIFRGRIENVEQLKALCPSQSILGGQAPEGIVIKNYSKFYSDKKVLMAKYVREEFKEVHAAEWKKTNPTTGDVILKLIAEYRTEARWEKAVQHLREAGRLEGAAKDIGALMKEVEADIQKECQDEIKAKLWKWAWEKIARGSKAGLPEWYKNKLLESALPKLNQ